MLPKSRTIFLPVFPRFNTLRPSSLLQIRCLWENRETAGCMQTWISKRLMARLIEYRRVIKRRDSPPRHSNQKRNIQFVARISNSTFMLDRQNSKTRENPAPEPEPEEKRNETCCRFALSPDSIFISMMKRQYLSRWIKGGGKRRKKREKYNTLSVFDTIATECRWNVIQCKPTYLLPLRPPPRHWARLGIVQPEA